MSRGEFLAVLTVTVGLSWALTRAVAARPFRRVARANYRGVQLNPLLGLAIGIPGLWVLGWLLADRALSGDWVPADAAYAWVLLAAAIVMVAGLIDDLSRGKARGLRGHLRALGRGELTSGILKVASALIAGAMVVVAMPSRPPWVMGAGVVLIAGASNLWNGLDLAPGRAGRPFLLAAAILPFVGDGSAPQALVFILWFAALPAVGADLRERAMLGDCGSNLLGFALGAACYGAFADPWVLASAVAVVVLNLLAETVSLSALIERSAFLGWFDRVGTTGEWRRFSSERARRRRRL